MISGRDSNWKKVQDLVSKVGQNVGPLEKQQVFHFMHKLTRLSNPQVLLHLLKPTLRNVSLTVS